MTLEILPFLVVCVFSIGIVFAMPGWRSLSAITVVGVLGCILAILSQFGCKRNCGDTLGFAIWALLGVIPGFVARSINLGLAGRRMQWPATVLVPLVLLFSVPAVVIYQKNEDARLSALPLDDACGTTLIPVTVGGVALRMQPLPFVHLENGPVHSNLGHYFRNAKQTRALCARFGKPGPALDMAHLVVDPGKVWAEPLRDNPEMWTGVCSKPRHAHVAELCSIRTNFLHLDALDWPAELHVFVPERSNMTPPSQLKPPMHAVALLALAKAGGAGAGSKTDTSGTFEVSIVKPENYWEAYWIARDGAWTTPDGKPYSLQCTADANAQGLVYCLAGYPWRDGVHLHYRFRAPADAVAAKARKVDAKVAAILAELVAP